MTQKNLTLFLLSWLIPLWALAQDEYEFRQVFAPLTNSNAAAGSAVAIHGNYAVIGAPTAQQTVPWGGTVGTGLVYVLEKQGTKWVQIATLRPGDLIEGENETYRGTFGASVAFNGETIVVGANSRHSINSDTIVRQTGAAYVFQKPAGGWRDTTEHVKLQFANPVSAVNFGISVAISPAGGQQDTIFVGASGIGRIISPDSTLAGQGAVYAYFLDKNTPQDGRIVQEDRKLMVAPRGQTRQQFGRSLAYTNGTLFVGADITAYTIPGFTGTTGDFNLVNVGAVHVFPPSAWQPADEAARTLPIMIHHPKVDTANQEAAQNLTLPGRPQFGFSIAVSGNRLLVGAPSESIEGKQWIGGAYAFRAVDASLQDWEYTHELFSKDTIAFQSLGFSVAISGDLAVVGVRGSSTPRTLLYDLPTDDYRAVETQALRPCAACGTGSVQFGLAVAIDGASQTIMVGQRSYFFNGGNTGAALFFQPDFPPLFKGFGEIPTQAPTGYPYSFTIPAASFELVTGDTLLYQVRFEDVLPQEDAEGNTPTWFFFDPATRTIMATPPSGFRGRSFRVNVRVADDPAFPEAITTMGSYVIEVVNGQAMANGDIPKQQAEVGLPFNFTFSDTLFSDPDYDALEYSILFPNNSPLPGWLTFNASTRTFGGTPPEGSEGDFALTIVAEEVGQGGSGNHTNFTINIRGANVAPVVANPLPDLRAVVGQRFDFYLPDNVFSDANGDPIIVSLPSVPPFLSFISPNLFTGTPTEAHLGEHEMVFIGGDNRGGFASDTLILTVVAENRAPVVNPNATLYECTNKAGEAFSWTLPDSVFSDADGDVLTLRAEGPMSGPMPEWLRFNAQTRTLSGTPSGKHRGFPSVLIYASDGLAQAYTTLVIEVENSAPVVAEPLADQLAVVGSPFNYVIASNFTDPDEEALTYTLQVEIPDRGLTELPAWLTFNAATKAFLGTPATGDVNTYIIRVTANDGGFFTGDEGFSLGDDEDYNPNPKTVSMNLC